MKILKELPSWTHCNNRASNLKAPARGLGGSSPLTYEQAKRNADNEVGGSPHYGYIFGEQSDYIGIDVDVDPSGKKGNATKEIPTSLLFFLAVHPTHVHYSPGGHGLHAIYKLTKDAREMLNSLGKNQGAASIENGALFDGDWRYRNSFLTVTDRLHESSIDTISEISFEVLCDLIPAMKGQRIDPLPVDNEPTVSEPVQVPPLAAFEELMTLIPATFDAKAKRACKSLSGTPPESNYDYWVLVGNACAHYAVSSEACGRVADTPKVSQIFSDWSRRDPEGFEDDNEVLKKFNSLLISTRQKLATGVRVVTYGSLQVIAKNNIMDFPDMLSSKGGRLRPDPSSTKNMKALLSHEEMELIFDPMGGGIAWSGPEELMAKWFCPQMTYNATRPTGYSQICSVADMAVRIRPFLQNRYAQSVSASMSREFMDLATQNMKSDNAFKSWITDIPWDGVSRFEEVCNSIQYEVGTTPEEAELYNKYIRWSLLSMIGIHFWPEDSPKIPAMMVLTGPEYTYKSSWAEWLVPKEMSNYVATCDTGTFLSEAKDWLMFMATKAVVVINECEPMFTPKHEQKVKAAVDSETVSYRDPYGKAVITRPRVALIIGTTNKSELFTGNSGTRKIWQIPVEQCDSMLIKQMNLQQLYAEVYCVLSEFKVNNPKQLIQGAWALSEEDRQLTNRYNSIKKGAALGVQSLLAEVFGRYTSVKFDISDMVEVSTGKVKLYPGRPGDTETYANVWTLSAVKKLLTLEFPDEKVDRTALKYALDEYAGFFTSTQRKTYLFKNFKGPYKDRVVHKGRFVMRGSTEYYIMPPITDQII